MGSAKYSTSPAIQLNLAAATESLTALVLNIHLVRLKSFQQVEFTSGNKAEAVQYLDDVGHEDLLVNRWPEF